jgi:hypothetical protein
VDPVTLRDAAQVRERALRVARTKFMEAKPLPDPREPERGTHCPSKQAEGPLARDLNPPPNLSRLHGSQPKAAPQRHRDPSTGQQVLMPGSA